MPSLLPVDGHTWVAGLLIPISSRRAIDAVHQRKTVVQLETWARVPYGGIYCARCRQDYSALADNHCINRGNEHLRGGFPHERAKRLSENKISTNVGRIPSGGYPIRAIPKRSDEYAIRTHAWVAGIEINLDEDDLPYARADYKILPQQEVKVLSVSCEQCANELYAVFERPCEGNAGRHTYRLNKSNANRGEIALSQRSSLRGFS
ncbi:hypothetical protein HerbRD11066_65200 [Herbidospora sp. RD11066]